MYELENEKKTDCVTLIRIRICIFILTSYLLYSSFSKQARQDWANPTYLNSVLKLAVRNGNVPFHESPTPSQRGGNRKRPVWSDAAKFPVISDKV